MHTALPPAGTAQANFSRGTPCNVLKRAFENAWEAP